MEVIYMGNKVVLWEILEEFTEYSLKFNEVEFRCKLKVEDVWLLFIYKRGVGIYVSILDDMSRGYMENRHWGIEWEELDYDGDGVVDSDWYIEEFTDGVGDWLGYYVLDAEVEYVSRVIGVVNN